MKNADVTRIAGITSFNAIFAYDELKWRPVDQLVQFVLSLQTKNVIEFNF